MKVDGMAARLASSGTLVLCREDVAGLLPMSDCIEAVERGFLRQARGETIPAGVLGTHLADGGFHVKTAGLLDTVGRGPLYAAKVNANFPRNPDRDGLPTIQGVILLFDAANGRLLALLDSIDITSLRTAAATGVAAKYLAPDSLTVTICGCGMQSRSQLRALACVRRVKRAMALDLKLDRATRFADEMSAELGFDVAVVRELGAAAEETNVWVTCTPAKQWFLGRAHVAPGAFVAAVGADSPQKQELEPELLASSVGGVDVLEQCATSGDLHHSLACGLMRWEDFGADLADIVSGKKCGRLSPDEIVVFDSTGTALEDVAAAALVYQRALSSDIGFTVHLGGRERNASPGR
jgi:alanine dehydrogenase